MKKTIKLTAFNIVYVIIAILCFSKRFLGLGFDASVGALKLASTVALTILGVFFFFYGNYLILAKKEKVEYKIDRLTDIKDYILALEKCKKTDPSFKEELSKAISQLEVLERRETSLKTLLEQNDVSDSFSYLNQTAKKTSEYVFANVKRIINRLIVFDNEEYLDNEKSCDISIHKKYVSGVIEDNDNILKAYQDLLVAVSGIADTSKTNLDELKNMTKALNYVLKGEKITALEEKYAVKQEENHHE